MECSLYRCNLGDVGLGDCVVQRIVEPFELAERGLGNLLRCCRSQFLGDCGLQPQSIVNIEAAQGLHDMAAMRLESNESFTPQGAERFAHRCDTDPQGGCRFFEAYECARTQRAFDYR